MILLIKQEFPKIEFELGRTEKKAINGELVRVFLTNTYPNNYILKLETDLEYKQITEFIWEVVLTDNETHKIRLLLTDLNKSVEKYSNTLTING